jgi:hypothetical protein
MESMDFGIFFELSVPRPFTGDSGRRVYENALAQPRLADALGFTAVWAVEHHFLGEYSHCSATAEVLAQETVLDSLRLFLRDPKEEIRLEAGDTYVVRPRRPHLVTNGGETSAIFLVLQGIGEYDFVPLVGTEGRS